MNSDCTFDMARETVEGLLIPVYNQMAIPPENVRALWGIAHWMRDMVNQLAGEG